MEITALEKPQLVALPSLVDAAVGVYNFVVERGSRATSSLSDETHNYESPFVTTFSVVMKVAVYIQSGAIFVGIICSRKAINH